MMRLYAERRDHFAEFLRGVFDGDIELAVPDGGLAFWVRFPGVDLERLLERSHDHRVHFQSPRAFASDGATVDALRLGFASLDVDELKTATERLAAACRDVGS
jgi:GntR family transcriptional regulator/MocR family aminotransferase